MSQHRHTEYSFEVPETNGIQKNLDNNKKKLPTDKYRVKTRHSIHSVSWRWPFLFLVAGALLYYLIFLLDYNLPYVVTELEAAENPHLFSGARSKTTLKKITNLGPRVVGTPENEIMTPKIIMDELADAKLTAHSSQTLNFEVQKGSGAYNLEFEPPFINVYLNVQNVIAILEGSSGEHGILLNCHYDSVPNSDGASDDAINCAIMIELVRVMSKAEKKLKHNVIFLFNGAEETPLMASHLFLSHRWAKTARLVLNLEAAGLGGRAILFQSGPKNAWLFHYYARNAPHPHAQIIGEELFQSGAIPSDTDFRIFRDFGNMPGLDFAFCRNGFVYHTVYDREEYIHPGSHQHLGDNLLATLRELGNAPEMEDMEANNYGRVVYFDYLGWFLVRYSVAGGIVLNIFVCLLSIFSVIVFIGRVAQWSWLPQGMGPIGKIRHTKFGQRLNINKFTKQFKRNKSMIEEDDPSYIHVAEQKYGNGNATYKGRNQAHAWIELGYAVGAQLTGMLAAFLANVIMGAFIDGVAPLAMPFYSNIYLIFPLYWCPALCAYTVIPMVMNTWREKKRGLSLGMTTQLNLVASQIPWALVLFIMTCANSRSSAVIMVMVLFAALANLTIHLTPLYRTVHRWVFVYLIVLLPGLLYQMYIVLLGYMFFLPIVGRSGTINGDLYIAVVSVVFILFMTSYLVPLFTLVRRPGLVLALLVGFAVLMIPISVSSSVGMPYQNGPNEPSPQRYWIMHTERQFFDESQQLRKADTGYFVLNLDRNSPKTIPNHLKTGIVSTEEDCKNELYCGLPLYLTRMVNLSPTSSWIPTNSTPTQPAPTILKLMYKGCSSSVECSIAVSVSGSDRMTVTLSPRQGVSLHSWNLPAPVVASGEFKGRPSYFIHIGSGELITDFELKFNFNVTGDTRNPLMDIAVASNHAHHEKHRTTEFSHFIKSFPDYVTMIGWISAYKAYVF